ncbi:MAG TPA: sugar phosphate isomerase/epimerase [Bacteroidales bacterium]|nr:sugar phosphate isomerase/epimerase [Bacteroidales bacterium]
MLKQNLFRATAKVVICGLLLASTISCKKQPEKFIGLQLWSVRDTLAKDVRGTIAQVGKIGYKFVETIGYNDGKFLGMEPAAFKALCDSNNVQLLGSHTGAPAPDSAAWDSTMAWWDKCIDAHVAAGIKYIVQPWMGDTAFKSISGLDLYCKYFNAVGEKCNAKGIRFGYHNHDKEFQKIDTVVIYDYLLQHTDPSKVAMELDLYWIHVGGGDAVAYFNKYPGRFEFYHVKDEAELGASGKMDFKPYFDNASKAGMKYYIVEVEEYNFTPLESVAKSYEFIKNAEYVKK